MDIKNKCLALYSYYRRNGVRRTGSAVLERLALGADKDYSYEPPSLVEMTAQKEFEFEYAPLISIVVPVFNPKKAHFISLLESLSIQTYSKFEVIFVDASQSAAYERLICARKDSRFLYVKLEENLGISGNANVGLERARGDYVGVVDHDDEITPDCLFECVVSINDSKKSGSLPALIYTDEDKYDGINYFTPHFKETFNYDMFLTNNYICHFAIINRQVLGDMRFRLKYDGSQDYDLFLRVVAKLLDLSILPTKLSDAIIHVPKVLYHWRAHEGSTSQAFSNKPYAHESGRAALGDFLNGRGYKAKVCDNENPGFYYILYKEPFFENRREVGAIGGNLILRGKIFSGEITPDAAIAHFGMPKAFGGYFHRVRLQKDVYALDLRNMRVCPELENLYAQHMENLNRKIERLELLGTLSHKKGYRGRILKRAIAVSTAFCNKARAKGYLILYDPRANKKIS